MPLGQRARRPGDPGRHPRVSGGPGGLRKVLSSRWLTGQLVSRLRPVAARAVRQSGARPGARGIASSRHRITAGTLPARMQWLRILPGSRLTWASTGRRAAPWRVVPSSQAGFPPARQSAQQAWLPPGQRWLRGSHACRNHLRVGSGLAAQARGAPGPAAHHGDPRTWPAGRPVAWTPWAGNRRAAAGPADLGVRRTNAVTDRRTG